MTQRHKVFVSYHHANDQNHRDKFENLFSYAFKRRNTIIPDNSFPNFVNNRSGAEWQK